ncbi:hypothetical protein MPTK1_6g18240 [Marchantia polymorpha subsp. ruderalis]|uniref:Uncharacterized protein n=2 Tax=Marchantia polymorpha TaxID=3197 RepID=A0AAF6BTB1_MARPO|nr:hypothetical protein MARPO_0038s0033 [Marchantia polymorpha]BBN15245.1 hypothetical protein Mp_6g18240 [Marchantia polymorpha subsp. ruderalis]|eukprot:PTQ40677.1 hypothetical protein MARPO_0038s0033 [Marchantia polymorpha]
MLSFSDVWLHHRGQFVVGSWPQAVRVEACQVICSRALGNLKNEWSSPWGLPRSHRCWMSERAGFGGFYLSDQSFDMLSCFRTVHFALHKDRITPIQQTTVHLLPCSSVRTTSLVLMIEACPRFLVPISHDHCSLGRLFEHGICVLFYTLQRIIVTQLKMRASSCL